MRTRLLFATVVVCLGVRASVHAQGLGTFSITAAATTCTPGVTCALFNTLPGNVATVSFTIGGTFTGTLQFEATGDNGVTWTAVAATPAAGGATVTSTTAAGVWWVSNVGYTAYRVRASTFSSGTASVAASAATGTSPSGVPTLSVGPGALTFTQGGTATGSLTTTSDSVYVLASGPVGGTLLPVLKLGGTTSTFPAFRRNSSNIEIIKADASAYSDIVLRAVGFGSPVQGSLTATAPGTVKFQNTGATSTVALQFAAVPTCSTNCGTSPSVVGSDTAGIITLGTTPASGFVLTFGSTWTAAPSCTVQSALTTMVAGKAPIAIQTTTGTMTVTTDGVAPATADKYAYLCFGVS